MKIFKNITRYIEDKEYKITIINNIINITNYLEIKEFSSCKIVIKNSTSMTTIIGKELVITKMQDDELLITGEIKTIELWWNMKNTFLNKFQKTLIIKASGKSINRYINKILKKNIKWTNLKIHSQNEITFKININDLDKIKKNAGIYKIEILKSSDFLEFQENLKKSKFIIFFIIIGIIINIFLSNIIFDVQIVHSSNEIIRLVQKELDNHNIKKYTIKKDYNQIQKIKNEILEKNKLKLEWIEIEVQGTKYIIRVEERKIKDETKHIENNHIIAKKSGIIKEIYAEAGEIVRKKDEYVKQGDIIISGEIIGPNNTINYKNAKGTILAEVWKNVNVDYPKTYKEEKLTGLTKDVYILEIFNKRISLFDFNKYQTFKKNSKSLYQNNFKNIKLIQEKQYEMTIIDDVLTPDEAYDKALELGYKKISESLNKDEKILDYKILEKTEDNSSVHLKIFFKVLEDIGIPQKIDENPLS